MVDICQGINCSCICAFAAAIAFKKDLTDMDVIHFLTNVEYVRAVSGSLSAVVHMVARSQFVQVAALEMTSRVPCCIC